MSKDFEVKDHSVSGELFTLKYDARLHMYRTYPKPLENELPAYYDSEDYISHTDGSRSLFERAYQFVKRIALKKKYKLLLSYYQKENSVLDIGAGTGDFIEYLSGQGWSVSGAEPSSKARDLAKSKGLDLKNDIAEFDTSFDIITMWHVLEHVYHLEDQISWLKEHLTKNGTLFIAVPNFESTDAHQYKSDWAAYDVPRHLYHFSKKAVKLLFEENGFQLVDVKPMKFDAYYVSLLSEKYKSGKINYVRALRAGMKSNSKAKRSKGYSSQIYVLKHQKN